MSVAEALTQHGLCPWEKKQWTQICVEQPQGNMGRRQPAIYMPQRKTPGDTSPVYTVSF